MSMNAIEHVVVLMLENRSFDNLLGWAYEHDAQVINNLPPAAAGDRYRGLQGVEPGQFINAGGGISSPPRRGSAGFTTPSVDPGEEFQHVQTQFFESPPKAQPTMKGYLQDFAGILAERGFSGADLQRRALEVMQSYTPGQLPVLNQLARHYAVCDDWFASMPSQTNPNRAFSLCGTSCGLVNNGDLEKDPRAEALERIAGMGIGDDRFDAPTIFNALERAGVDWTVFWQTSYLPQKLSRLLTNLPALVALATPISPALAAGLAALLAALSPFEDYLVQLSSGELDSCYTWRLFPRIQQDIANAQQHFQKLDDFHRRARAGTLPRFSYLEPFWTIAQTTVDDSASKRLFTAMGNDYHPPGNILVGEEFVAEVYRSLVANRAAWEKTLFVITFDEFVGTFDHVAPTAAATPPWGNNGTPPPKPPKAPAFDFKRFGGRVPTILVSPLVKKNTVFRAEGAVPFDHTSVIRSVLGWAGQDAQAASFGQRTLDAPKFDNVLELTAPRTDELAMPFMDTGRAAGELVRFGDRIHLRNANGKYYSSAVRAMKASAAAHVLSNDILGFAADLGLAADFPTLDSTPVELTLLDGSADPPAQVADGAPALLVSLEASVGANNMLGAWSDSKDCYYYDQYLDGANADKQCWTVQQAERRGQPLRYGDKVYLVNKSFAGQRLAADWFDWITTSTSGEAWTLEAAVPRQAPPPTPPTPPTPGDGTWNNAPALVRLAASQQGGARGAQLWGVDPAGQLRSSYQQSPGGPWSGWSGVWNGASPAGVVSVAAAQQNNGVVRIWVVDGSGALFTNQQQAPGADWVGWSRLADAPPLREVAASQQGGARGAQLWGIDTQGQLRSSYQESPGGSWSPWSGVWNGASPGSLSTLAAAQQNDGTVRLWVLDSQSALYSTSQRSPGGDWNAWSAAGWQAAPPLQRLCASQQGGARGAQLWGIDTQGQLRSTYQTTPGGPWSTWSDVWNGASPPRLVSLAAAQQNNGAVRLWVVDVRQRVFSNAQTGPGEDWTGWEPAN